MSHVLHGAKCEYTLKDITLGKYFFDHADRFADNICQIDASAGLSETYASVKRRTVRVAINLQKKGITSEHVVVSCAHNSIDTAIPIIASLYLGAKVVSLDPTLSVRKSVHLLEQVKPRVIFVDKESLDLIEESLSKASFKSEIIVQGEKSGNQYLYLVDLTKDEEGEDEFQPVEVNVKDVAVMFFSSGTTGMPKAICHSHKSFLNLTEIAQQCGFNTERILHFTTFYWISGMIMLTRTFFKGHTRIFARDMEGEEVLSIVEKYKVTSIFIAPIYTYKLTNVKNPERFDTRSLQCILTGGTAISKEQFERLNDMFDNADIVFGYGLTEVGMGAVFNPATDRKLIKTKIGSSGKPAPDSTLKIVDINTEEPLGPNQKGEIRIKSPSVMVGYYNLDSSECFDSEGYLKTGDIGYYDEDQCLYVVERLKEMFKYRSWHIVPSSIESILLEHPAVKEAVVCGIPAGEEEGELPAACVVLRENGVVAEKKDIKQWVEERVSDVEKLRGGVFFLKDLPKTPSGKFMRKEIKEMIIKSL